MIQEPFTPIPNIVLDEHISNLSLPEIRVLFVILRQTYGYINVTTKQRKRTDWIMRSFFVKKTKLCPRSVSLAISSLIKKKIIVALGASNVLLENSKDRKGKKRIYYAYRPTWQNIEIQKMKRKIAKELKIVK
jgi:phage replication O-like protein O